MNSSFLTSRPGKYRYKANAVAWALGQRVNFLMQMSEIEYKLKAMQNLCAVNQGESDWPKHSPSSRKSLIIRTSKKFWQIKVQFGMSDVSPHLMTKVAAIMKHS